MPSRLKIFKISANDIYYFYIDGLPNINKWEKAMIKLSLNECFRKGYLAGYDRAQATERQRFMDSLESMNY